MQKIILEFKNLDKDTYKIMKYGLLFSTFISLISVAILLSYIFLGISFLYHLGIILIETSFSFAVEFIICGIVVNFLRKHRI